MVEDEFTDTGSTRVIHLYRSNQRRVGRYYIHKADKITVMTVDPGFAGQPFIPEMLDKLAELKAWREREGLEYEIEVDGSCNQATYEKLMAAGADVFTAVSTTQPDASHRLS